MLESEGESHHLEFVLKKYDNLFYLSKVLFNIYNISSETVIVYKDLYMIHKWRKY